MPERVRTAAAYVPVWLVWMLKVFAPCASVTAPSVSLLLLLLRPLKVIVPPTMVIGAASLTRLLLSIHRLLLLLNDSVPA